MEAPVLSALVAVVTVFALAMTVLALVAYRRERRGRFLLVAFAFGLLLARSVGLTLGLASGATGETLMTASVGADAALLAVLYLAAAR